MVRLHIRHLVPVLAGVLLLAAPARAQGDLLVAPTRVVLAGSGSAEVVLSNLGATPATYRISLELRRMDESGDFQDVPEAEASPAERAALDLIRYAPRRVLLQPGQPQAVRISARIPPELPEGEYRVHMGFWAIPASQSDDPAAPAADNTVSIRLTPIYGITIPVFVRHGRLAAETTIDGARLVRSGARPVLEVSLGRTGQRSVYGELTGRDARGEELFTLRGVAVYPEVTRRTVQVALTAEQLARISGPLRLEYRELPEAGGALLAAATVPVS